MERTKKVKYTVVGSYSFITNKRKINKVMCLCKDCNEEYYCTDKMVMLKDEIWEKICDDFTDLICSTCIEKRMGREIQDIDFKNIETPCNQMYLEHKKSFNFRNNLPLSYV